MVQSINISFSKSQIPLR